MQHRGKLGDIGWSPDGSKLAMIAGADINDPIAGRLFVVSADGGEPTQLQPQYEGKFEQFQWSGNNTLFYLTSTGVWSTYGSIKADGSGMTTMLDKGKVNLAAFDRTMSGSTIFAASSLNHPQELYKLGAENSPERLTNSNPWLDSLALGKQEVVSWKAGDGTELQGILIYPTNYEQGQPR
ncbi:MAG: hypothetical protein U5J63_14260 [Fodinibius sp.]|nr:hypothetical protein [Fodinibius sp.]